MKRAQGRPTVTWSPLALKRAPLGTGVALIAALLVVVFSAAAQAAPGDLDPTFSGDGKQTTDFGFGSGDAAATVRQPDGKIVAVGTRPAPASTSPLARYNPNGTLDTSFSGDGRQTTDFGGDGRRRTAVALQADGKIVVVGSRHWQTDFALARYNPNGSLDTSFSGDGKQTTDFGGVRRGEGGGAPGGRQDRRGRHRRSPAADFALARYNPNGSLDTSFSGDGKQTTDFGGHDAANGVALQADGKIVVVGTAGTRQRVDFALARYNPNGSLDTSFSGDGKQTTDFGGIDGASGVALQADGKIVAVGCDGRHRRRLRARPLQPQRLARHQLLRGRQADDRLRRLRRGANGVALQATARSSRSATGAAATSRSPATTRTARSTRASPATASRRPTSAAPTRRTAWRSRATARSSRSARGRHRADFALARYNPNGSLDTSFSGDGKQTTDFPGFDQASGVAVQGDGKIVAVGGATASGDDFALARYNAERLARHELLRRRQADDRLRAASTRRAAVALQADGKIVVVGPLAIPGRQRLRARPLQRRTARWTRASPATASRRPTSAGPTTRRPGWRSRRTARSSWSAQRRRHRRRLRDRPLQPERLPRHELLG